MPLYAKNNGQFVSAFEARPNEVYRCIECNSQVKPRKGASRVAHFYHLQTTPSCRLYSKSEDHLLLQLELQKRLPPGEAQIESPFPSINRVADVLWEKEKIIFEIQCSKILETEALQRIREYEKKGYAIIWILDDRLFNKKILRPAENLLRGKDAYFAHLNRQGASEFYDQFEILSETVRVQKSARLKVDIDKLRRMPRIESNENYPSQINARIKIGKWYCVGDVVYRALMSAKRISYKLALQNWKALETFTQSDCVKTSQLQEIFDAWIAQPYLKMFQHLLDKAN